MDENKKKSVPSEAIKISTKQSPKAQALANAPEEVLAKAIRDAMLKDKENGKTRH